MFKVGDYVKVKPNTLLESGDRVSNWAGQVDTVFDEDGVFMVDLDAKTLNSLDDSFLNWCMEVGTHPYQYAFDLDDLEVSKRRDSDVKMNKAMVKLYIRMVELVEGGEEMEDLEEMEDEDEGVEEAYFELKDEWVDEFLKSSYCKPLTDSQQGDASFVASTFMEFMFNYEYVFPGGWTPANVSSVCLEVVPRKITSEMETFETYGDFLVLYLQFLGSVNYISNSLSLIRKVEKIKSKIPIEAKNPNNWGMAKSLMISAQESGVNLSSEEELEKFLKNQQLEGKNFLEDVKSGELTHNAKVIPLRVDPFKEIGRNDKISVKYGDGRIVESIKFKKVESDLRDGICELIQK